MSCCGDDPNPRQRLTRQCTDVFWLCVLIAFLCVLVLIAAFALVYGNPLLLINGHDSFGNICGSVNEMSGALDLSGIDMTGRRYLFDLDVQNVQSSIKVCVKECPSRDLNTLKEIEAFYKETGSFLCRYDFNFSMQYDTVFVAPDGSTEVALSSPLGPCPVLPVYKSESVLRRCVPVPEASVTVDVLSSLYESLNSPAALEQLMADLYSTSTNILLLTLFAFFFSMMMVLLLKLAPGVMAWVIMVSVSISSIVGSGLLWWTYCDTKWQLDNTPPSQMLEESARNERWFLTFAIVASILTLVLQALVIHVGSHISSLVQLFQEASNCLKVNIYLPRVHNDPEFPTRNILPGRVFTMSARNVCSQWPGTERNAT